MCAVPVQRRLFPIHQIHTSALTSREVRMSTGTGPFALCSFRFANIAQCVCFCKCANLSTYSTIMHGHIGNRLLALMRYRINSNIGAAPIKVPPRGIVYFSRSNCKRPWALELIVGGT